MSSRTSNQNISTHQQDNWPTLHQTYQWSVPEYFNLAEVCCHRWANDPHTAQNIAVMTENEAGDTAQYTYQAIQTAANQLSNLLQSLGVQRGQCVGIVMPQRIETVIAHIAIYQLGAIAMPLSMLFGPDALCYRFNDSQAPIAIVDETSVENCQAARAECTHLQKLILVGDAEASSDAHDACWSVSVPQQATQFTAVQTKADEAALLIYTSGTTGPSKGALIPHRAMIGNLTGFVCSQNWFPQSGDVFWSPADWAWTGGLWDALLPSLYFGKPILGYHGRFSAETAFYLLEKYRITNTFLFPTALKMMMKAVPLPRKRYKLKVRAIMSAGEAVGETVFAWCRDALGVELNEMFGQTEMNYIVGNSAKQWPVKPGSMGRAYPGHQVAVIDEDGQVVPHGTIGEVALHRNDIHGHPDPIFFLGYWKNPSATKNKYSGDWCRTGDLASMDADGYLWYQGRADDMFKAAGYRIGPSEIENCLVKHPSVANCAVVPSPDAERGAVVKAFIVLTESYGNIHNDAAAQAQLIADLQKHVRGQLAPYEYPKLIEFIDALPMTTTGKVQRRILRLQEVERVKSKS